MLAKTNSVLVNVDGGWTAGVNPNQLSKILHPDGSETITLPILIPDNAQLVSFTVDVLVAWDDGFQDMGILLGEEVVAYGFDCTISGRKEPVYIPDGLLVMANTGTYPVATVVVNSIDSTTGAVLVTCEYIQY